jgi:hypothetical protein
MSKLERGKRAARRALFPRELGHISQEEFLFCECCNFLLLERPYNRLGGHTIQGRLLHVFRGSLFSVFCG